ncbi:hypothetical protein [Spongiimicrobium salis]|uniref:hypothetical protein n=1 Tax=Spongiimicrobium salis TaxID=1667022 RepID=UPI00374D6956
MKNTISSILFLLFIHTAIGQNSSLKQSDLIGCWKHYPEESELFDDMTVYRPCNNESFPNKWAMRARNQMNFNADGKCNYLRIGPTDINSMKPGKWILDSSTKEVAIFDLEMNLIRKFEIVRLEKELLGVRSK